MDERVAKLEALVEVHERALAELRNHLSTVDSRLSGLEAAMARLEERIAQFANDVKEMNRRSMWRMSALAGLVGAAVAGLVQLIVAVIG